MTKSIKFPLERVLKYRRNVENAKIIALERSRNTLENDQAQLNSLEHKKDHQLGESSERLNRRQLSLDQLKVAADYMEQLNDEINSQARRLAKSNEKVSNDRNALLKASKDRKILAKLRERHAVRQKKQMQKAAVKKESEIALRRQSPSREDEDR